MAQRFSAMCHCDVSQSSIWGLQICLFKVCVAFHGTDIPSCIPPIPMNQHLVCLQTFATAKSAAINKWTRAYYNCGTNSRSGIAESKRKCIFNFDSNCHTSFWKGCTESCSGGDPQHSAAAMWMALLRAVLGTARVVTCSSPEILVNQRNCGWNSYCFQ